MFIVAFDYVTIEPLILVTEDGWFAWEHFCSSANQGQMITVRKSTPLSPIARFHPRKGVYTSFI